MVEIDASPAPEKLNGRLTGGGQVAAFPIARDSLRVIYRATQDSNQIQEFFGTRIGASGPPTTLNVSIVPFGDVRSFELLDPSVVLYIADQDMLGTVELYLGAESPPPVRRR